MNIRLLILSICAEVVMVGEVARKVVQQQHKSTSRTHVTGVSLCLMCELTCYIFLFIQIDYCYSFFCGCYACSISYRKCVRYNNNAYSARCPSSVSRVSMCC